MSSNVNHTYDHRGDHIYWSVNGHRYGGFDYQRFSSQYFKFDYDIPFELKCQDYQIEIQRALIKLYVKYQRTLAICVSGRDSEIIVREAAKLGIKCKIYFLNLWNMNKWMADIVRNISHEIKVEFNEIYLDQRICLDEVIFESYDIMPVIKPTYLCLPYLFDKIPMDELIVVGEGDLAKDNPIFSHFYHVNTIGGIPILSTEIIYRLWAQRKKRHGEFYFHSSTPELVISAYNNPLVKRKPPKIITEQLIDFFWPNLSFRQKTLNWEQGEHQNLLIREILSSLKKQRFPVTGTLVPHRSVVRENCYLDYSSPVD